MDNTLFEFKVTDKESFVKFVRLLIKDLSDNPQDWENKSLENFLEALSSYSEDIQGYYDNMKLGINAEDPSWRVFADLLMGARIYE